MDTCLSLLEVIEVGEVDEGEGCSPAEKIRVIALSKHVSGSWGTSGQRQACHLRYQEKGGQESQCWVEARNFSGQTRGTFIHPKGAPG